MCMCVQGQLSHKLDANMLPKGDGGLESMMPMVLEMQSKLAYIESKHHITSHHIHVCAVVMCFVGTPFNWVLGH